jgi:hypothetical protein
VSFGCQKYLGEGCMRFSRVVGIGSTILAVLAAVGCGGGSSSTSSLAPPPSSTVSVTVSPPSSTVGYGGTQQFTASVTGSTNTAVTWSVSSASSSSSQIGTISSSGFYTAPPATSAPPESVPQPVLVTAGNTSQDVNISVPALNSSDSVTVTATSQADLSTSASATVTLSGLSIIAVGQCVKSATDPTKLNCTGSSTGTQVSLSQSAGQNLYLFVAGYGILPGTTYSISGNDVVVTQPPESNFQTASNGVPAVFFQIAVPSTAALGPRNLIVRNSGNELASFAGAVAITQ